MLKILRAIIYCTVKVICFYVIKFAEQSYTVKNASITALPRSKKRLILL